MRDALACYLVLDPTQCGGRDPLVVAAAALAGGVTCLQLRAKAGDDADWLELALGLRSLTRQHGTPFLINDRVELAKLVGADGVHLGPRDLAPAVARTRLGPQARIGVSLAALGADPGPADYIGLGPVFATQTKGDAKPPLGIDGLGIWRRSCPQLPAVAIGGLTPERITALSGSGVDGVAIVSAICAAADPARAARACRAARDAWDDRA